MSFEQDIEAEILAAKPRLTLVQPPVPVPPHFDRLRPLIEESLEGSLFSIDDLISDLAQSRAQFWPGLNSVIVTSIESHPKETTLQVRVAGGDMKEIIAMGPGIEAFARINGCASVMIEGRQGWSKVLKAEGYAPFSFTARKVL